jgi:hypothetical protein
LLTQSPTSVPLSSSRIDKKVQLTVEIGNSNIKPENMELEDDSVVNISPVMKKKRSTSKYKLRRSINNMINEAAKEGEGA